MSVGLDKKISLKSIIIFTLPTMSTMIFLSLYTIVDGVFISRYVGAQALSATNIVYPVITLVLGVSIMMSTGGSAIVAMLLGEKREKSVLNPATRGKTDTLLILFGRVFLYPASSGCDCNFLQKLSVIGESKPDGK